MRRVQCAAVREGGSKCQTGSQGVWQHSTVSGWTMEAQQLRGQQPLGTACGLCVQASQEGCVSAIRQHWQGSMLSCTRQSFVQGSSDSQLR